MLHIHVGLPLNTYRDSSQVPDRCKRQQAFIYKVRILQGMPRLRRHELYYVDETGRRQLVCIVHDSLQCTQPCETQIKY